MVEIKNLASPLGWTPMGEKNRPSIVAFQYKCHHCPTAGANTGITHACNLGKIKKRVIQTSHSHSSKRENATKKHDAASENCK